MAELIAACLSLFGSAFIAATLFPASSEAFLLYFTGQMPEFKWLFCGVATVGNTLGGLTSYVLAQYCFKHPKLKRFTPSETSLQKLKRFGTPVLFFSWLPIIGDALCLAAGALKLNIWASSFWICFGKFVRYVAIIWFL